MAGQELDGVGYRREFGYIQGVFDILGWPIALEHRLLFLNVSNSTLVKFLTAHFVDGMIFGTANQSERVVATATTRRGRVLGTQYVQKVAEFNFNCVIGVTSLA